MIAMHAFMMILWIDIVLQLKDTSSDSKYQNLDMTELVAFGLKDEPDGIHFPLVQTSSSPRQWKVERFLEL
jgi:hypothetical protein